MTKINQKQRGAVSLFVVIFAALLITIVTVSFVRNMVQDQTQASNTDLSQSAADSAKAGTEDAKRALLRYQTICNTGDAAACLAAQSDVNSSTCNTAVTKLNNIVQLDNEVKVQTNGSNNLAQAYTCVKIFLDTDDYIGSLNSDSSKIIPLAGVTAFDTIRLDWFNVDDLQGTNLSVDVPSAASMPLLTKNSWISTTSLNRPSVMRTQLVQFNKVGNGGAGFNLTDFDANNDNASTNTLFLYPSDIGISNLAFATDMPKTIKDSTLVLGSCSPSLDSVAYSCSSTIKLPVSVQYGDHTAYLNLAALYKKTSYRISLSNSAQACDPVTRSGAGCVKFNAVQPEIDSTGRANDLFRRTKTRVELTDVNFPYPAATVDTTGSFCKYFKITDKASDFDNSGLNCTP